MNTSRIDPAPFLRGNVFPPAPGVPYPRARYEEFGRLPQDTWAMASIPVGVRLEFEGDAEAVDVAYVTATDNLGYRGEGAGTTFALWRDGAQVDECAVELGEGSVRLVCGEGEGRCVVYLPEGMRPEIRGIEALGGTIEPAGSLPRWLAYGDSVAEGWVASGPGMAWPHIAAREQGLDVANLGYAGAARGEIVSAEHLADLEADVISITHGTNCWTRIPFSVGMFREGLRAFLDIVRQGHPETPVLVSSPIIRPDAEETPNRLGATLVDLRLAMEEVAQERIDTGDEQLRVVSGFRIVTADQLGDGIHPNDDGHRAIASALGPEIRQLVV